jgi:hypothetical protein
VLKMSMRTPGSGRLASYSSSSASRAVSFSASPNELLSPLASMARAVLATALTWMLSGETSASSALYAVPDAGLDL